LIPPLNVHFVWHPLAKDVCRPLADQCFSLLNRNDKLPFSRGIQIPVYFRSAEPEGQTCPIPIDLKNSERNIVFTFIDDNFVCDAGMCEYLRNLYKEVTANKAYRLHLVSLTQNAYKMEGLGGLNYIRLHDVSKPDWNTSLLCAVSHEICRLIKSSANVSERGDELADKPIRIFLSHAKADSSATSLALAVKDKLDNSHLTRFFDAYDIAPGYDFSQEIKGYLGESMVVAFRSDEYGSRPFCQLEILEAKRRNCPMLLVDVLENHEDRAFPFMGNIPVLHVGPIIPDNEKERLQRVVSEIVSASLVETLRFLYASIYFESIKTEYPSATVFLNRPPEMRDLFRPGLTSGNLVVYPDPPLEESELEELKASGLNFATPLTREVDNMTGVKVGLSLSEPPEQELAELGLSLNHINVVVQEITRHLMVRGAELCYGGDLRPGGYTEFICEKARVSKHYAGKAFQKIKNYLAWPIYLNSDISWEAKNKDVLDIVKVTPPRQLIDNQLIQQDQFVAPNTPKGRLIWAACLAKMREEMIASNDIRISLGGSVFGYKGTMPGILEEILIAKRLNKPLFLLGGFGGVVGAVCDVLKGGCPKSLTEAGQLTNCMNDQVKEALDLQNKEKAIWGEPVNYDAIVAELATLGIAGVSTENGLSVDENKQLMSSTDINQIVELLFKCASRLNK
jgi:hypothetical protein